MRRKLSFDYDSKYFLSFHNYYLDRQLDLTWQALIEEFKLEWNDLFITFSDENEFEDEDIVLYELSFSSKDKVFTDAKSFSIDSVVLESTYDDEEDLTEESTTIPDDFEFDEFFFEYFYLFMIFSYFFFPFFLLELSFFSAYIFYIQKYSFINEGVDEDEDIEPFDFLESELDISHYDFAEFHFEEYLSFEEMFLHSGFWKNKPYSKLVNLLKTKN